MAPLRMLFRILSSGLLPLGGLLLAFGPMAPLEANPRPLGEILRDLKDRDFRTRAAAVGEVPGHPQRAQIQPETLKELLHDRAGPVRVATAGALARIGGPKARELLDLGFRNPSPLVQLNVIDGLGEAPDGYLSLIEKALADGNGRLKEMALRSLSKAKSPKAIRILAEVAKTDPSPPVRQDALSYLVRWVREGNQAARDLKDLFRSALSDRSETVRVEAVRGLGYSSPLEAPGLLQPLLEDRSEPVRKAALEVLTEMGGHDVLTVLKGHLEKLKPNRARLFFQAIARMQQAGEPIFSHALRHANAEIREIALDEMPHPTPRTFGAGIRNLVEDPVASIREKAVLRLADFSRDQGIENALGKAAFDGAPGVRKAAVKAAEALLGEKLLDLYQGKIPDPVSEVYLARVEAIAKLNSSPATNALSGLLARGQQGDLESVLFERILSTKYAAGALVGALKDCQELGMSIRMVESLGNLKDPRVAPELVKILENSEEDLQLRTKAAEALGKLEVKTALSSVEGLYLEGSPLTPVQEKTVVQAMKQLGGQKNFLLELRRHPEWAGLGGLVLGGIAFWFLVLSPRLEKKRKQAEKLYLEKREEETKRGEKPLSEEEMLSELEARLAKSPGRRHEIRHRIQLGLLHYLRKDPDRAVTELEQVIRLFQEDDQAETRAIANFFSGKAYLARGDRQMGQRKLSAALKIHDPRIHADTMSLIATQAGDLDQNIQSLLDALPFDDDLTSHEVWLRRFEIHSGR